MSLCPVCGSWQSKVKESRRDTRYGWKWRLRDCSNCEHRWSTYEVPAETLQVESDGNPDGRLER
jgi:transcriptional regulator NrdR family protein